MLTPVRCAWAAVAMLALYTIPLRAQVARIDIAQTERRVFQEINRVRRSHGLNVLTWNESVAHEARRQAYNMAARKFFSHDDPVRGALAHRLKLSHVEWMACAENLFRERGYKDPSAAAVKGWMESSGHRKNILDPEFTQTGIGVAVDIESVFIVQDFIRPLPKSRPQYR